jgi:3'-5' exoribonuclease
MTQMNDGDVMSAIVLIKSVTKSKTREGSDYLKLEVNDGHQDWPAFVWDPKIYDFKEGEMVKLKGEFGSFKGKPKITVISASKTTETVKLPSLSSHEIETYTERFNKLRELVTDEDFKAIFEYTFDNESIWKAFITAPAAKGNHQAYLGGLLQHSVEVAELSNNTYYNNPTNVNRSLLITGALLHDIGKTKEYIYDTTIDRSTAGKLIGHTSLGVMIISWLVPNDFNKKKLIELIHIVLSHHGKRDWGAPVEPLMKEALIVHNADMINCYSARFDEVKEKEQTKEWSEFDNTYNRSWYLHSTM